MIDIYSDPHIGLNLAANTTNDSRIRLRNFVQDNVNRIIDSFPTEDLTLCSGDFYHSYSNSEEVLYNSLWAASRTEIILAGNHDVVNIKDRRGTLDVIGSVMDTKVVPCKFGKVNYKIFMEKLPGHPLIYMVPHHSTQDLFMEALKAAAVSASKCKQPCLLVTHCNYDNQFIKDEATLNLTNQMASHLLKNFKYIVLGHEHRHKVDLDGRVIVVGSPHPTNFGDVGDKYTLHFDTGLETYEMRKVWSVDAHYLECSYQELGEKLGPGHQWVKVVGEVSPSEIHELSRAIRNAWKSHKPFAIKSEVKILTGDKKKSGFEGVSAERLDEMIQAELKNSPELFELWKELEAAEG